MKEYDLLVIGGGPAGMTVALTASRMGVRRILLVEREQHLGGILPQCLHQGFGLGCWGVDLTGPEFSARLTQQLLSEPIQILTDVTVLQLKKDRTAILSGAKFGLQHIHFRQIVLASGCREKPIGALPICGTRPAGIFTAGCAQKLVNLGHHDIGNEIVILGSGDIGLIMARQLTLYGKHIIAVIEQADACGGMARNIKNCIEAYQIPLICSATITEVYGTGRITGVNLHHLDTGKDDAISCDTLITAVGLLPERELLEEITENDKLPAWLHLCGNCDYVHQLVDTVIYEAEQLGKRLAGKC